ncbi:hypothetical protein KCU67_g9010, partial [Aureobasidium melanogenum]
MQNNTTTKKEAVRDSTQDNAPAASEPADKPKSGEDLAVEELADYYANSKPPGRRYPVSMAADMLNNFIDGDAGDAPVDKKAGEAGKKSNSDKKLICLAYQAHWLWLLIAISPDTSKDGPAFSTDTDPNIAGTRFVRFGLIPLECVPLQPGSPPDNVINPDWPAKDLNARKW